MGFAEFSRIPTSVRSGRVSLSSSSRFAASSGLKNVNPVTFPPGRARLDTIPDPKGSPTTAKTTGIVVVARFGGQSSRRPMGDDHIDIEPSEVRNERRKPIIVAIRPSVLDDKIPSLLIAELQPFAEAGDRSG